MSVPKFSIITINYNDKSGLEKTLNSVFSQTAQNFEYIVIDGNSTDGSKSLLELNASKFTYWCSEPDQGIYNAMNKGIRKASGRYLLFLNSGDWLHDSQIMSKIDELIDEKQEIYYADIRYHENGVHKTVTFPDQLPFSFFYSQNISHQASFIQKELFNKIFYYNEEFKIVSDWEFFTCAICKENVSYKHLDLVTTDYDGSGISSIPANHLIQQQERKKSLVKHFPAFTEDYQLVPELKVKKVELFFKIKSHPLAWKFLKPYLKLISLFLPKNS
jgi:glycosyltransferase involved in cell wall biosynthesis